MFGKQKQPIIISQNNKLVEEFLLKMNNKISLWVGSMVVGGNH